MGSVVDSMTFVGYDISCLITFVIMMFVVLWRLSHYDVCRIMTVVSYDVCRLITFVGYDVCHLIKFIAYDVCRMMNFVANYNVCRW